MDKLQQTAKFTGADEVIKLDGLRVEYPMASVWRGLPTPRR